MHAVEIQRQLSYFFYINIFMQLSFHEPKASIAYTTTIIFFL